jgi:hypothetical protein
MALFGRRPDARDDLQHLIELTAQRFAEGGLPVVVMEGREGVDTVLLTAEGAQYPVFNLFQRVSGLKRDSKEYRAVIHQHVDGLVFAQANPAGELDDAEFVANSRVRLAPASLGEMIPVSYARPFAPGVIVALCIDRPTTVDYVNDDLLAERNLDLEALYNRALKNVMAEPIDSVEEIKPGLFVVEGDSFFTASKVVGMSSLLGSVLPEAPNGIIFGVPHRHLIVAHPLVGVNSVQVIGDVAMVTAMQANEESPGGPLSPEIYFWHEGVVEPAGSPGPDGEIRVIPGDRLLAMLNSLS